jgi:hypothetical protein
MARTLWAGPGVVLEGRGEVEIALHPGGYVRLGDEYVLVAVARAPRGPLSLLVTGLEDAPLRPGERAWVDGALHVGEHTIPLLAPSAPAPLGPLRPGWRAALIAALESAPGPPASLSGGLAALRSGDVGAGVAALAGVGEGLTPAGDDVLAGYAAWQYAAGSAALPAPAGSPAPAATPARAGSPPSAGAPAPAATPARAGSPPSAGAPARVAAPPLSALAAGRASPLGLAYLRCAERGLLPEVAARVIAAIRAGDADAARRRARALSRWGSSSGAAILWGVASAP